MKMTKTQANKAAGNISQKLAPRAIAGLPKAKAQPGGKNVQGKARKFVD